MTVSILGKASRLEFPLTRRERGQEGAMLGIVILRADPFSPFDAAVVQKVPIWSAKAFAHNLCVNE
jgi:hypothetical protein